MWRTDNHPAYVCVCPYFFTCQRKCSIRQDTFISVEKFFELTLHFVYNVRQRASETMVWRENWKKIRFYILRFSSTCSLMLNELKTAKIICVAICFRSNRIFTWLIEKSANLCLMAGGQNFAFFVNYEFFSEKRDNWSRNTILQQF